MTDHNQKRDSIQKKILREIRIRYVFAVCLIGSFAVLTFTVNQTLNRRMNEDFRTINLSGRQRMLSQRIALLTMREEILLREEAIHNFRAGLEFLIQTRFVKPEYNQIYSIYSGPKGLEAESRAYLEMAESDDLSMSQKEKIFAMSQTLLHKYENVTYLKQHISEVEFGDHLFLEIFLLLINLGILTFEIIFIFRPMARKVEDSFDHLNQIEEQSFLASRLALIGEVASSIGHEIKNPLFVVRHYTTKLMSEQNIVEREHIHDNISKNIDRISRILKSLSTQSREASHDSLEKVSIASVIEDALEVLAPKIKYGNISVDKDLKFEGAINCRSAAISQVIANLLSNAIDAVADTDVDKRKICIESGQDNDGVFLRITDSGPGVSDDMREKIFESFITTKKNGKGSGLGLPISKKIMEEHQGTLLLNSNISSSCFELRFPA
ncbi:MAG: ATP-binding protein [Bdellovibrionota bacterium]